MSTESEGVTPTAQILQLRKEADSDRVSIEEVVFNNDAILERMNVKHAFIHSIGGRPAVTSHIYSEVVDREILEFSSPDSIAVRYANESVQVDNRVIELGVWWLKNAERRSYQTVIFDPSKPKEYKNCLNLWEGFSTEPIKGSWQNTLRHVYRILCNSNSEKFKYTIRWLAWCVQNPAKQAEVCVIFKGKEGAGKGFIFTQFVELFGIHGFTIANRELLTGKHNGHLQKICFLFADEAYYPGDREVEGVLKQLITQPQIAYRSMYKDAVMGANRLHIAMSTNNQWVIPAGDDARRYFINAVDDRYAKGQCSDAARGAYFSSLWREMANGGRAAMFHDLYSMDLHGWHPRDFIPDTEELEAQKFLNLTPLENALFQFLSDGIFPGELKNDEFHIESGALADILLKIENRTNRFSMLKKAELYKQLGAIKKRHAARIFWHFPTLAQMRANWDKQFPKGKWDMGERWMIAKADY